MEKSCPIDFSDVASTSELVDRKVCSTEKVKKAASSKGSKGNAVNKKGTLVQATLSNVFEKVDDEVSGVIFIYIEYRFSLMFFDQTC